ncbi:MAG: UDP-N-acetylmuramoyl-L-alanine--D-glutamate ligase [Elusimicrobia bacterium]|nr:UDP-N-acetylmuramoyl-L-alanine--D-glutamate ligase [Elusimicrobiota bacterium]
MFIPEKFKDIKALVIGAGRSGVWCANLLASRGFRVLLTESKPYGEVRGMLKELRRGVKLETGGHTGKILRCGFAIKSPGLSHSNPLILKLKKRGIPVFSEIETALAFSRSKNLLAVTGTNGKTTTTLLLGEIMKNHLKAPPAAGGAARQYNAAGTARVCGNIGTPAAKVISASRRRDAIVMEVSSYQLQDSSYIRPASACVLNVTPDHLDHHKTMADYIAAKAKVFKFQRENDFCVFNYDDKHCRRLAAGCPSKVLFFSSSKTGGALSAWIEEGTKARRHRGTEAQRHNACAGAVTKAYGHSAEGGPAGLFGGQTAKATRIIFSFNGKKSRMTPPALPGLHNLENAMCAGLMALSRGISPRTVQRTFRAFKGVEHRIEPVRTVKGVTFINDSKATNVDSTLTALKALGRRKNIWLILGGLDKGSPYKPLSPYIKKYVKFVLTIGAAAPRIEKELSAAAVIRAGAMPKAVSEAFRKGGKGDIVLLSPACASFDQFRDFEDRGKKFREIVKKL